SLPVTGQRDLAADHHDARIPIMGVVGVHHPGLEPTIEDLVALASQIGFEFSLVHDKPSCEQVRTKRLGRPAASYRYACAPTRARTGWRHRRGVGWPVSLKAEVPRTVGNWSLLHPVTVRFRHNRSLGQPFVAGGMRAV